jgi:predicted HTH domain antitoxin
MSVSVTFPEELLVASREDRDQFARQVTIYTLGHLYEQGKISSSLAARVLGCDRWEFYRLLTEHGFSVIDYAPGEQAYEAETSRELVRQLKQP